MAPVELVSDSTDWLPTPLSALAPLESSLRCQVCKDFYETPMITSCSHTFCSLCIRRYLSQEGRCPACRQNDQESKLRRNWVVEELVTNFEHSRKGLLDFAKQVAEKDEDVEAQRPKKRRKVEADLSPRQAPIRSTRSQSSKQYQTSQESLRTDEIADSESEYEDELELERSTHFSKPMPQPDDGLVACPGCDRRMKAETVFTHLDTCTSTTGADASLPSIMTPTSIAYTQPSAMKQKERLPTLAYSMLTDNALRKKLKELGISNQGPKLLMQKRHTEWVNLWNANCDSRNPRTKRELLNELEIWNRTQGRQIANNMGPNGVMAKDFDGDAYVKNNKNDFDDLIRKAREKAKAKKAETEEPGRDTNDRPEAESADAAKIAVDLVSESPVHDANSFLDLPSPVKPGTQELQHRNSQPQNIPT